MGIRTNFGGGGGQVVVQQDGTTTVDPASTLNFTGSGVSVTDAGGEQADIDVSGAGTQANLRYPRI